MPELLAMVASTVNSYTRLVPGYWAPTAATWGVENRTCALRVIQGGAKAQRVEYRIAAADINPYLAIAVAIGSGLWGIEHRIEPDEPISGNAYDRKLPAERQLPRTLTEAAERLAHSRPRRSCSARRSWRTTPPAASGRSANSAAPSPTGSWHAISRSYEHAVHLPRRWPRLRRAQRRHARRRSIRRCSAPAPRSRCGSACRSPSARPSSSASAASSSSAARRSPPSSPGRWDARSALPRARCAARSSARAT